MKVDAVLENPCEPEKDHCLNCHSHFMAVRPLIKAAVVSRHFVKDLKDEEEMKTIVKDILDCSNTDFHELHRFEENIDGNLVFRAKKQRAHIVYCVDRQRVGKEESLDGKVIAESDVNSCKDVKRAHWFQKA